MSRQRSTTLHKMIEAYRSTDSLFGKPYCKIRPEDAAAWVDQHLARCCKNGDAVQLTETVAERFDTKSSAITNLESEANAGLVKRDQRVALARCKVKAWPSVGSDPIFGRPTKAPLPTQPGGIRIMSREELERLSAGVGQVFVGLGDRPVDNALRQNQELPRRLRSDDFVEQFYSNDEQETLSEKQERLYGVPVGCRGGDVTELDA